MFLAALSFCPPVLSFTLDLVSHPIIFPGWLEASSLGRHPIVWTDQTFPQLRTLALLCPSGTLPALTSRLSVLYQSLSLSCFSFAGWLAYCLALLARDTPVPPRHPEGQHTWHTVTLTVGVNWTSCSVPAHRLRSLPRQETLLGAESG